MIEEFSSVRQAKPIREDGISHELPDSIESVVKAKVYVFLKA